MRRLHCPVVVLGALIVSLALTAAAQPAEAEWPNWLGPTRDGKSPDTGLLKSWPEGGPKLLWKINGLGEGYSNVAVARDTVYTTGTIDEKFNVFAIDLDGKPKGKRTLGSAWTKNYPSARSTPAIDGDRMYVFSGNGDVACLHAGNGSVIWTRNTKEFGGEPGGWGYSESVLVIGGRLYLRYEQNLYCFDVSAK